MYSLFLYVYTKIIPMIVLTCAASRFSLYLDYMPNQISYCITDYAILIYLASIRVVFISSILDYLYLTGILIPEVPKKTPIEDFTSSIGDILGLLSLLLAKYEFLQMPLILLAYVLNYFII